MAEKEKLDLGKLYEEMDDDWETRIAAAADRVLAKREAAKGKKTDAEGEPQAEEGS